MRTIEDRLITALRAEAHEEREREKAATLQGIADAHASLAQAHIAWARRFMPHTLREDYVAR